MSLRALEIPVQGPPRVIKLRGAESAAIQRALGGAPEIVPLINGCLGLVDEQGKAKHKARNPLASGLVSGLSPGEDIVGTMLVVGPEDRRRTFTDVPSDAVLELTVSWIRVRHDYYG